MDKCIQVLPSAGSGTTQLVAMIAILLGVGIVSLRASRHNSGRLMAVGLPIISVLSFSAPSTQTNDNCLPTETSATITTTTVAPDTTTTTTSTTSTTTVPPDTTTTTVTPGTTTTVPVVTTTSVATTTSTIATQSELKIVFLGQIRRDGASSFGPLILGNTIFCPEDTADVPLCVTFVPTQTPNDFATRNLRITDEWQLISLSCNLIRLYDRSITFNEAFMKSVSPLAATGTNSGLTTRPLTNSDTVYIVTDDEAC